MKTTTIREVQLQYGKKTPYSTFAGPESVAEFLRKVAPNNVQEHVIAVYLDAAHAPIGYSVVSTGIANACPVHPREIFQRAVLLGAVAVILAHNHPSGDCQPSKDDALITEQIKEAGKTLGIKLLDHVIFTDDTFYSFQSNGRI